MTDAPKSPKWTTAGRRRISQALQTDHFSLSGQDVSFSPYVAATNGATSVIDLIGPIVIGEGCLIVTGYQDFLSALSIIMDIRPGIAYEEPDTIRILFGTNTDNLRYLTGPRRPLPEHVHRHFMSQTGVFARDMRDLKAVQAIDAIVSGAIRIRVFDEDKAKEDLGRSPGMMHANLFINDEFAVAGSANFSQRGMSSNIEFNDRVLSGQVQAGRTDPYEARRDAAETFWKWGREWHTEATEILSQLLRSVSPEQALHRVVSGMQDFHPWRPVSARMGVVEEDLVYAASQSVYEYGLAHVEVPGGASKTIVGQALSTIVSDMYERCIMRDDDGAIRRHGSVSLVSPLALNAWREGRRGPMRIIPSPSNATAASDLMEEIGSAAGLILDGAEHAVGRVFPDGGSRGALTAADGRWVVGLANELPGGLALESAIGLLETAGTLFFPQEAIDEVGRTIAPLTLSVSAKRQKRTPAKAENAQREGLKSVASILCRSAKAEPIKLVPTRREVPLSSAQKDALAQVENLIIQVMDGQSADFKSGEQVAFQVRSDLRRLFSGLSTSIEALRSEWSASLGARLKNPLSVDDTCQQINQGMLPIFGGPDAEAGSGTVDQIESIIFDKALSGLDAARAKLCGDLILNSGRSVILVETHAEVSCIANRMCDLMDSRVFAYCPKDLTPSAGNDVVAAGDMVGKRVGFIDCLDHFSELSTSSSNETSVLVMRMEDAEHCDFNGIDAFVTFSSPACLKTMSSIRAAMLRVASRGDGRALRLHCISHKPTPTPSMRKASNKAFKEASIASGAGVLSADLTDICELFHLMTNEPRRSPDGSLSDRISSLGSRLRHPTASNPEKFTTGGWGADFCYLKGASQPFTAFFLDGNTGRRGDSFMPPRIVLIQHTPVGDVVVRNQTDALDVIERCYMQHILTDEDPVRGDQDVRTDGVTLEVIGKHLSEISHWDIRPERVAVLAKSLAEFLSDRRLGCDGETVLGDLSLASLELLAERWATCLGASWVRAKVDAADRLECRSLVDGIVGIARVEEIFKSRTGWELDTIRADMSEFVEDLRFSDREKSKTIQDRVAVILRAEPY